eukprot:CAMPEP_0172519986 /NCGR_PEP_ID=MMETSP1066-20121228/291736_1 /TAXON_ID=671091 /ORGANISM="Coscinodiscus wailesii, Strain CCMP2513" /LENGTH=419 /DNA_ID=CAMNT_0013302665 /DNA_START=64 /DNA_END=1322 /DNA_ORIENTATION=-
MRLNNQVLALCFFQASLGVTAFVPGQISRAFSNVALKSTPPENALSGEISQAPLSDFRAPIQPDLVWEGAGWRVAEGLTPKTYDSPNRELASEDTYEMFPFEPIYEKIEGGGTVRTYPLPPWADRCQYFIKSNGRPIKAEVNLWDGGVAEGLTPKTYDSPNRELASEDTYEMFPFEPIYEKIEGGGTVRTYPLPPWADRCQYFIKSNGRPIKAEVNLWLGPIRKTHTNEITVEDGQLTPYSATLKFKKDSQVLKISTKESAELPIWAGVIVPSPERHKILQENTEQLWKQIKGEPEKKTIQGGSTTGGGGAIKYWAIPENVQSVQVLAWSIDVSKKSFRCKIELLQGPDNKKQEYMLQCGGGSQPYHGVIQTPGEGCVLWIRNLKFLEDGLFQVAVIPYEVIGDEYAASMGALDPYYRP